MLYTGTTGPCAWSVVNGDLDDATTAKFIEHLRGLARSAVRGQVVLDMLHGVAMPTPVQRRQIVDVLKSSPKLDVVAGHALVVNTPIGRGLLTAINWVVRPPFEEKVFADPREAMRWLAERNPAVDPVALLASIRREAPGFERLRW